MTNQITDPPLNYPAGTEFDYSVWSQDTTLSFHSVPWDNNYRDIVTYDSDDALNRDLNASMGPALTINKVTYHRPNMPITVNVSHSEMMNYNYVRVSNPRQPIAKDSPRHWYYFVLDAVHAAPNTTRLVLQLDVWQSFGRKVKFGNSYVEQGHLGVANEKNFDNFGRDYLTVPEGLNVGSEYQTVAVRSENLISTRTANHSILVISTVDLEADAGTVSDPKLTTAKGGQLHGLPSGASQYFFNNLNDFTHFMSSIAGLPWISQGIVSISLVPSPARYGITTTAVTLQGAPARKPSYNAGARFAKGMFGGWRDSNDIRQSIPGRYRHLRKFYTFPYMCVELTAWSGSPVILKPESWNDAHATVHERASFLPPSQRVAVYPRNYNKGKNVAFASEGMMGSEDDGGEFLDLFTQVGAFPTFAVVNNGALGYMAQNAHGLAYSAQSADWSQQVALRGASTSYDQATGAMGNANEQTRLSTNADIMQTNLSNQTSIQTAGLNAVTGMVGGTVGGAMGGGPAGAAAGALGSAGGALASALSTGITTGAATQASGIRTGTANASNTANQAQSSMVRDTNYDLSTYAAKGNYQNAIAGINAKVQDAQLTQPSTSGQIGGEALHVIHDNLEYSLRWKLIDDASMAVIGEYWLRYGYAIRRFITMPDSLHCMTHFTYWKLSETYIKSARIPESYKQVIRGIFEKGVTVWREADMIGSTDIGLNKPVGGFTL